MIGQQEQLSWSPFGLSKLAAWGITQWKSILQWHKCLGGGIKCDGRQNGIWIIWEENWNIRTGRINRADYAGCQRLGWAMGHVCLCPSDWENLSEWFKIPSPRWVQYESPYVLGTAPGDKVGVWVPMCVYILAPTRQWIKITSLLV